MQTVSDHGIEVSILPELGGRVSSIRVRGTEILLTPSVPNFTGLDPFHWSSFIMAPWCNRIPEGILRYQDHSIPLIRNGQDGSAIHGLVYASPWTYLGSGRCGIHAPADEFPWSYSVWSHVIVEPYTIRYSLRLRNESDTWMPAGLGWHPWFDADDGSLLLRTRAKYEYQLDEYYIPIGDPKSVDTDTSPHTQRLARVPWGTHSLYTGVRNQSLELAWPRKRLKASVSFGGDYSHLVIFAHRAFDSIAVEPQTHAIDGHRRAAEGRIGGIQLLEPKRCITIRCNIRFEQFDDSSVDYREV